MAKQLGQVAVGTLVKLNENGSPVEVIVGRQNYESELNGNGRTLLIRIGSNYTMQWGPSSMSDPLYAASTVDTWLNTAYKAMLDAPIQEAIATTKFYYTPSGGASRSILERAVFLGSATEFGFSNSPNGYVTFNTEGSPLPENIVDKIQYPPESWTRTPTAQFRVAISTHGSAWVPVLGAKAPDFITHVDPFFTLPSSFYVNDDGEISPIPLAPGSIDVPVQVMVGKPISISWSAVDGAASYSLERNTDSGGWSQIYSGANTSYTDTAGEWENAQYRVRAYANGVYSDYVTSETVPVAPLSALVISGSDGSLGTLTNDVQYVVSSSGTSALTVTESAGRTTRTFTATNGATIRIPVMDLPTGTGTIKITASTNPGSGVVTVTRNWTYSKTAPTFANAGSTAQLQQNGKNVFPLTLLECVRGGENLAPGGFGFGDAVQSIETTSAGESYETYCAKVDAVLDGMPDKTAKLVLAYPPAVYGKAGTTISLLYKGDANYAVLSNIGSADTALCGWRMIRLKKSSSEPSAWQPFEWEHPPMQLGVEYRTTERYDRKPVYAKAVNFGALPANSSKSVAHGISDMARCFEVVGSYGVQNLVGEAAVTTIGANTENIMIATDRNLSAETAIVLMKYTKTTD